MEETIRYHRPEPVEPAYAPLEVTSFVTTHVGNVRKVNEDSVIDRADIGLWAVADGVGGAYAGNRASQMIVEWLAKVPTPVNGKVFFDDVSGHIQAVNARLCAETKADPKARTIASTVVCLLFFSGHFCCLWAGDSRLYRLRHGNLERVTKDHSEVQSLLDIGLISEEEAKHHPRGNVITRAVGAEEVLQLDNIDGMIEPGDAFLICTDGLTKVVEEESMRAAIAAHPAEDAVRILLKETLDNGAPDNVTIAIIKTAQAPNG